MSSRFMIILIGGFYFSPEMKKRRYDDKRQHWLGTDNRFFLQVDSLLCSGHSTLYSVHTPQWGLHSEHCTLLVHCALHSVLQVLVTLLLLFDQVGCLQYIAE